MTFPYRLAAIDLDETLLGPDKRIGPANAAAVRRLQEAGVHVTLASGRRHENMLRYHRELGLHGPIVSCNGALVKDAETGEALLRRLVPAALAIAVVQEGERLGITQNYYHTDGRGPYVTVKDHWTAVYEGRTMGDVTPVGDLKIFGGEDALKIIWLDDPERIMPLRDVMRERFPDLYITTTDPEYLEFMAPDASKAAGVEVVAGRLGVPREAVLAFGDGHNDVPMLEWAGMGVAMAHAHEPVKAAADAVAPAGDRESSLARAVDALFDAL